MFIVEALGGGIFTYTVDLANQLCETYDVYIAYSIRQQTPADYENYFDKRINLIKVTNFTREISLTKDYKAFIELKKIAKKVNPDIIHLHSSKAGVLGRWAFNGKKIPVFYTPHGYSFLMQDQMPLKKIIYKAIEVISSQRYCTTISCSRGEHNETLKFTNRAMYVSNGVNINELQSAIDEYSDIKVDRFTVFTLGRICYQKNPELFNKIASELPDVNFIWIGDGELKNILTSSNITVTGWVEREKALEIAFSADTFVLTSLWEGLPMALLESMYMKKACIVSNVIGNRDTIRDGVNGFVCEDIEDYTKAIESIKSEGHSSMRETAYTNVITEYNTHVMGKKYKIIYEKEMSWFNEKNRNNIIRIFSRSFR